MTRTLTDGEREILAELNRDAHDDPCTGCEEGCEECTPDEHAEPCERRGCPVNDPSLGSCACGEMDLRPGLARY